MAASWNRRRLGSGIVLAMLAALLVSPHNGPWAHAGTTLSTPANGDSYVAKASPAANYGSMPSLVANGRSAKLKRIYCEFAVTGVPAGDGVASAKLQLYAIAGTARVAVHVSASGWSETTVAWPGPSFSTTPSLPAIAAGRAVGSYATADVTAAVGATAW